MEVKLLAHTQLSEDLKNELLDGKSAEIFFNFYDERDFVKPTNGQTVALSAIRQCYSYKTAPEVLETESVKYFGEQGQEGKRLFNHIIKSGHSSTVEHISFTFSIEKVSRALLAQLTRHRVGFSYSVQSQRYNKFSSDSRSGGFDYVTPESIKNNTKPIIDNIPTNEFYDYWMKEVQKAYDLLIKAGVPQEDARSILPNAATCNLVMTVNLRALLDFYSKRKKGNGAQAEIAELAERLKEEVIEVEPWVAEFFN